MNKPNYRLGKIGTMLEANILAGVILGNPKRNIEDKTFCFTNCSCDEEYKCDCNTECRCDNNCSCDKECKHCRCVDYCKCDIDCKCDAECSCDGDCSNHDDKMWLYCDYNGSGRTSCSRL